MRHPTAKEPFRSARYVRLPALGRCELSYLHTSTGAAPPDMRDLLEVTLVDFGDKTVEHRGQRQRIRTGALGLRSPYEVGKLVRRHVADTRIRVLAIGESEIAEACQAADLRPRELASVLLYGPNPELFAAASFVFAAVEEKATALEIQTRLATCAAGVVEALGRLLAFPPRSAAGPTRKRALAAPSRLIRRTSRGGGKATGCAPGARRRARGPPPSAGAAPAEARGSPRSRPPCRRASRPHHCIGTTACRPSGRRTASSSGSPRARLRAAA